MLPELPGCSPTPSLRLQGCTCSTQRELFVLCQTLQMGIVTGLISKLTTNCLLKKEDHLQELTLSRIKVYFKTNSWIVKYKKKPHLSFLLVFKLATFILWKSCLHILSYNLVCFKKYSILLIFSAYSHFNLISSFYKLSYYWHIYLCFSQA